MEYVLRGVNEYGDPVDVRVRTCWRCYCLVDLNTFTMDEHLDQCHPPAARPEPRHALH